MQQEQADPFKFMPPSPPFGFMDRPRLLDTVVTGLSGRMVLLQAPAGYGKTALLASLAAAWPHLEQREPTSALAWYQLDPADDDPAVFVEGLVESVREVVPSFGKTVLAALRGVTDARADFPRLMDVFQDELISSGRTPLFMVLDDFHNIVDKVIVETLESVLKAPGSPLRLIISSEQEPAFYLSTLRTQSALVELYADDLRFTLDEVHRLLRQRMGTAPAFAASVAKETGGWPSATALAAAIVARSGIPLPFNRLAPTEHGYGLLAKEAIGGLRQDLKEGLLRGALMGTLEAGSARSLLGIADIQVLVGLAEEMCLPAARLPGPRKAIRYDPLFRAALEGELASVWFPQELRQLQREIAAHYAAHGRRDEAVRSYLAAWAYEEAATLVEGIAEAELARAHIDTVLGWLRAIPSPTRKGHPKLMVLEARALLARGRVDEARALLVTSQPEVEAMGDRRIMGQRTSNWARVHLLERRFQEAKKIAEEALGQLPEMDDANRAEVHSLLAQAHEMTGDLSSAFSMASEGLLRAEKSGELRVVVQALMQLGRLAELRGEYNRALGLTARAVERSTLLGTEDLVLASCGSLAASIYLERGQQDVARRIARRTLEASGRLRDAVNELRARVVQLRADDQAGAGSELTNGTGKELLAIADKLPGAGLERTVVFQSVASALLRRGRLKEGRSLAQAAVEAASAAGHNPLVEESQVLVAASEATGSGILGPLLRARRLRDSLAASDNRRWLAASLLLLADGYSRLGIRWRARANLERALSLAEREGYVGMPLRVPARADRMFAVAVREGIAPDRAGTLLGIDRARGEKLLSRIATENKPELRRRAEEAARGLEVRLGAIPTPRLPWPAIPEKDLAFGQVSLQSLGGINSFLEERQVQWPSADSRNLAAYLIVNRCSQVPRETVLADVWPDKGAEDAHVRLQVALYQLRETLGAGYPQVDLDLEARGQYRWDGEGCLIDVERFRELLRDADEAIEGEHLPMLGDRTIELLEEAVAIYQGEFLCNLDFGWCVEQREQLRSQLLRATRLLMDHYMSLRRWRDAISHGLKSLKSDPLQEDVVRDLMVCYFRIGDRASVMQQYREVKRLLAKERGAWPSEETRQLRVRLLGK